MNQIPLLTLIIFTPWLGALLLALHHPRKPSAFTRGAALVFSLSTLVFALAAIFCPGGFNPSAVGLQLGESYAWIKTLNVHYSLGIDGLSIVLVLLTGIIAPIALFCSWRATPVTRESNLFPVLFLLLQGAALGVFLAQDFFLWFLFWELSLFPAFFLIRMWGGSPKASSAAYQFVVYTMGGSAFMLLGFAALYVATGTLDFTTLTVMSDIIPAKLAEMGGYWPAIVFLGVLLGLAVKVPLFPFHTWLPAAYAEAPTGASMFLTAVMSKMGVYGFLRILWPIFPAQLHAAAPCLMGLALAGVVFGAYAAIRQRDLKRMIAYSSINHLSYCLLAIFAGAYAAGTTINQAAFSSALSGTILQMFNHGLSAAALFYCIGLLEKRSGGLRGIDDFGGVRAVAPIFAGLCGVAMFSSLGLPGLNGFVGEFLIFRGVFGLAPWHAAIATLGLLATALFLLTFWQRVFHGPVSAKTKDMKDLCRCEIAPLVPLVILMFAVGIFPKLVTALFNPYVGQWTAIFSNLP